ncbi:MAG: hypothetical protein NT133_18825 [Alphaproteobacteria bacterium]|nr:hypothetical protein [Alphaproteobacteria bacterium]
MSPRPSIIQCLLLRVVRHMLLVLDAMLGARAVELRARLDALPPGHRRRARLLGEIRRLARVRAMLAEPGLLDDPAFRGKAAEVARVRNDAGRRALERRRLQATPCAGMNAAFWVVSAVREEGRCTGCSAVA